MTLGACLAAAEGVGLSTLLEARSAASRAAGFLVERQRADGSWSGSPAATAQALIGLANAPGPESDPRTVAACARAVSYLRQAAGAALASSGEGPSGVSPDGLAAILTGLARAGIAEHQAVLSAGRSRLIGVAVPVDLADGTRALAFAPTPGRAAEVQTGCAVVDALLVTEGLAPPWDACHYRDLAAHFSARLATLLQAASAAPSARAGDPGRAVSPELQLEAAGLARALLSLGTSPATAPVAAALARLSAVPSGAPAASFALAEALRLAEAAGASTASPWRGWPERLVVALLDTQSGTGGWPAVRGAEPDDRATALALRAIQVAAGHDLVETAGTRP